MPKKRKSLEQRKNLQKKERLARKNLERRKNLQKKERLAGKNLEQRKNFQKKLIIKRMKIPHLKS